MNGEPQPVNIGFVHHKAKPVAVDLEEFHALPCDEFEARQSRLLEHEARIHRMIAGEGKEHRWSSRGIDQQVALLDMPGPDGQPVIFLSESEAARFLGGRYTADHIRRAIVRGGRCRGLRFAWVSGRQPTDAEILRERSTVEGTRGSDRRRAKIESTTAAAGGDVHDDQAEPAQVDEPAARIEAGEMSFA